MAVNSGDEDFTWAPPSDADMKVIVARRERQDKITKLMGDYLLKGYRMLADSCQECGTVLLQDKKQKNYCVACQELDSDVDKDNPALNPQAALSQVRERQRVFNGHEEPHPSRSTPDLPADGRALPAPCPERPEPAPPRAEGDAAAPRPAIPRAPAHGEAERAVLQKLAWASGELERASSVEYSSQLCVLIRNCADSLHSLKRLA
ncbi:protein ZNRD2 isoform X2 [Scyliorhinus canicula]|uniref:protein ZNRD2 isoform X2 n=1 Tax=Scyliorhinus canicula TaxID=7830 RepID=UPI0018F27D11|nr:protein ZNRD2 isoform X2 [Scyliorhinus canicula]